MKKVLMAASEVVPFIKTGGLADVAGALPKYLDREKYDVRVVLPKYTCMSPAWKEKLSYRTHFYMDLGWRRQYVGVLEYKYDNVQFYFIDNEFYFGGFVPYNAPETDIEKFAFFSKAVLSILPVIGFRPDIIHCNDWQTALIPVYLNDSFQENSFYRGIKTIMTIHNLKFQGVWDKNKVMDLTGLHPSYFTNDKLEAYGAANLLKGGIVYADKITTVSEQYAKEITMHYYGEGMEGLLRARKADLIGIVNGIDNEVYDPSTDEFLRKKYSASDFRTHKPADKKNLQKILGLKEDPKVMLIGLISRLTGQKGIDLIARVMEELCSDALQIVVLGTGEAKYEDLFRHYAWKYPDKVSANLYYSEEISHKIYAGADALLVPSLFEPCGLTQLIALRYGTIPIVRETGGLKDTVIPYNEYENTGTGFSFTNYNAHDMLATVRYAEHFYYDKKRDWNRIIDRAMACDFSWKKAASKYEDLYDSMITQQEED